MCYLQEIKLLIFLIVDCTMPASWFYMASKKKLFLRRGIKVSGKFADFLGKVICEWDY